MATKMKTHSWAKKRFSITGSWKGKKVMCKKSCNNHLLTNKWKNNKKFAYWKELAPQAAKKVKSLIH